jgi:hypothetical protein
VDTADYENETVTVKYIDFLSSNLGTPGQQRYVELTNEFMVRYALRTGLTLRGLQRVYTMLALALSVIHDRTLFIAPLVAGLAVLKLQHPRLYKRAKQGKLTYLEVEKVFGFAESPSDVSKKHSIEWSAGFWRFATDSNPPQELIHTHGAGLAQYGISRERLVPWFANSIVDQFKPRQR